VSIYVPCYNEERLIESTLDHIREALSHFSYRYEVLVYDDGSQDHTGAVVEEYVRRHALEERIYLIYRDRNMGIGVNYFDAAERARGEYFMVVSGDDSEPAESLRRVLNLLGKADAIVPYCDARLFDMRFNGDNRGFHRRLISILFASLVRFLSGHNLHYFNGCQLLRREHVLKYRTTTYGLGYQAELICQILNEPSTSYLEVKIFSQARRHGMPTAFRPKNVLSVAASLGRILRRRKFSLRPFKQ
jgi:glycosyltransferase involved in cell wall biosynthesis